MDATETTDTTDAADSTDPTDPTDQNGRQHRESAGHGGGRGEAPRGCVLVVDDEAALRLLIRRSLERLGFRVLLAESGAEAVDCLAENRGRIDAVILDVVLPDVGGEVVFDRLRDLRPDLPILLSSGYGADARVEALLGRGAAYFLEKPYGREQLAEMMERALGATPGA